MALTDLIVLALTDSTVLVLMDLTGLTFADATLTDLTGLTFADATAVLEILVLFVFVILAAGFLIRAFAGLIALVSGTVLTAAADSAGSGNIKNEYFCEYQKAA